MDLYLFLRILIREAGLFIYADVPDLGIVLQWDKGTTVILRVDPKWKTLVNDLENSNSLYKDSGSHLSFL